MMQMQAVVISAAILATPPSTAAAEPAILRDGLYEITSRLELPHVERWAIDQTARICLSGPLSSNAVPIPVLSANNPFAKCAAANLAMTDTSVDYDIVCPGRASAKAHASYTFVSEGFSGRVAMVMAAKNMTMTEVVRAHRLGTCGSELLNVGTNSSTP
jgi:Protein of unknown function (DUF3617)